MAEETKQTVATPETPAAAKQDDVVVAAAAEAASKSEPKAAVVEKEAAPAASAPEVVDKDIPAPEPEAPEKPEKKEKEKDDEKKIAESASFKEESNVVADLPNPQQKALDELKKLVQEALNKHELTAPPPPPPAKEEEKKPEPETSAAAPAEEEEKKAAEAGSESKPEEKKDSEEDKESKPEEKKESGASPAVPPTGDAPAAAKVELTKQVDDQVVEEKTADPPSEKAVVVEKVEQKVETVEQDGTKTVEEIKDIVEVITTTTAAAAEPPAAAVAEEESKGKAETTKAEAPEKTETETTTPSTPEEVSIWGVKLLEDEKSDTILLKFLRARDFKVKEAFAMLKSVVSWRKQFGIEELVEEETEPEPDGLAKVVYSHGVDKEGHPVIYNAFGEFQDKELYQNTFVDAEKRTKFLKGIILFLEKSIRNLDFTPDGICTLFQVIDLKNSPGLFFFKKDLRQAINQALELFQDNYPEFVAKQVYVNVPWWYPAYYRMTNAIFTPRTKSKFVFAGPSRSAETLFKYIAPEQVPVQYGGLSREGEQEFATIDAATEETIKPASKHKVEFEVTEKCTLVWEVRVVGWDVTYGADFVPSAEDGYTVIVQKSRKVGPSDEPIISTCYKSVEPGKIVLTIDNQTSKRKKIVYRSKIKPSD